jgi:anaerobic selenocysteine-containing dehydrogenase
VLGMLTRSGRGARGAGPRHDGGARFADPAGRGAAPAPGWTGRLDLGNAAILAALGAFARRARTGQAALPFRLIPRRAHHVHNSSCNVPATNRGRAYNPAFLAPEDAAVLGIATDDLVEIYNDNGAIIAVAEVDQSLRRGVVSMTHCFGDPDLAAERRDPRRRGAGTNWLTSNDEVYDAYTGQPLMSNVPVGLRRVGNIPAAKPAPAMQVEGASNDRKR